VKTTIELPDPLLRRAKATAAQRGESLKDLFETALRSHLDASSTVGPAPAEGWRRVFGKARPSEVAAVDQAITTDLERVDPADWR